MTPECARCGVTVYDLPFETLGMDADDALDAMFEHDGDRWLCVGCA